MVEIDCYLYAERAGRAERGLERIRSEAEDAVRSGAGHLVLTDQDQGAAGGDADDPGDQRGA